MYLYYYFLFEFVFMNLYNVVSFCRIFQPSSEEESPVTIATGVGKSNGYDADDDDDNGPDDDWDDEDDKSEDDNDFSGKKSDDDSGDAVVSFVEGLHVVQNHNPQCNNVGSNFLGLTSHLELNYNPSLGPFSEYDGIYEFDCTVWCI